MRVLSLCSGVGGIEIGVSLVENCHPVAFVERNEYCKSVLAKRWPGIPILDCISKVENIDCDLLTAGFPCQPWSSAGKKRGKEDERWIWPTIANIIRANRPGAVLLENVVGLISGGGLAHVLWDLANLGYDAEWSVFSCSQLGATHHRKRIFILGYDKEKFALHWAKSRSNDALGGGVSFGTRAGDKRKNFLADSNDEQRESRRDVRNGNEREHSGTSGESCEISSTISTGLLADSNDGQQPPCRFGTEMEVSLLQLVEKVSEVLPQFQKDYWPTPLTDLSMDQVVEKLSGHLPPTQSNGSESNRVRPNIEFLEWLMGFPSHWSAESTEPEFMPWEMQLAHLLPLWLGRPLKLEP